MKRQWHVRCRACRATWSAASSKSCTSTASSPTSIFTLSSLKSPARVLDGGSLYLCPSRVESSRIKSMSTTPYRRASCCGVVHVLHGRHQHIARLRERLSQRCTCVWCRAVQHRSVERESADVVAKALRGDHRSSGTAVLDDTDQPGKEVPGRAFLSRASLYR